MDPSAGASKLQDRVKLVLGPVGRRLWRFNLEGYERLPTSGPAILCPNHVSFLDSAFLILTLPRRISFVGKAEYLDDWKTKYVFPAMGMIPIDRSGGEKSTAALDAAEGVLRRGEFFGIFPEGTRSRDGVLHKGHTGAARLAFKVGCPIFPVGVIGTREIQPPDAKLPKLRQPCTIRIGEAIHPDRYAGDLEHHIALRQMTDEIMFEISELTGQQYRNTYATKKAEGVSTPTAVVPSSLAATG